MSLPAALRPPPSPWVTRFAPLIVKGGQVLDLACGGGRHVHHLLERGHQVSALDRDVSALDDLQDHPDLQIVEADLEDGKAFPLQGQTFDGVVVTNYLYRPILPQILAAVAPGGLLIYETFAHGNEKFGKPSNPDYLLAPHELLDSIRAKLHVLAYEHGVFAEPRPAAMQRLCARREAA